MTEHILSRDWKTQRFFLLCSGELYLALVQSTKARAKLVRVDPSPALSMPGVVDFISHVDVPGSNTWGVFKDEAIFATEEVNLYA